MFNVNSTVHITRLSTFSAASMDLRIAVADTCIFAYNLKAINFVPVYVDFVLHLNVRQFFISYFYIHVPCFLSNY